mmetsp:Transcript_78980/g.118743  ORF Transcript_78980/g.118743 Transcript_78980/m.118743 type:complete len:131 (+) Transcript_78980:656-1048(+)
MLGAGVGADRVERVHASRRGLNDDGEVVDTPLLGVVCQVAQPQGPARRVTVWGVKGRVGGPVRHGEHVRDLRSGGSAHAQPVALSPLLQNDVEQLLNVCGAIHEVVLGVDTVLFDAVVAEKRRWGTLVNL